MLAAWELWRRWKPDRYGVHMLDDLLIKLVETEDRKDIFSKFIQFWGLLKEHLILPLQIRSFHDLESKFSWYYYIELVFFDFILELVDVSLGDKGHQKELFMELTCFYEDLLHTLPESKLSTIQKIRCFHAQAHFFRRDTTRGEELFQQLINDYPHWSGGYAGLGDMYTDSGFLPDIYDEEKAIEIYQFGLCRCEDNEELKERIKDMEVEGN